MLVNGRSEISQDLSAFANCLIIALSHFSFFPLCDMFTSSMDYLTSNTWMSREVMKRPTPMPMKASPMRTNPGITMPADRMGCHAGSLCWVKAVLSGRSDDSFFIFTMASVLLSSFRISSKVCSCLQLNHNSSLLY